MRSGPAVQRAAGRGPAAGTGFLYDARFLDHDTGPDHPERAARLSAIRDRLDAAGLLARLTPIPARPCEDRWLTAVHEPDYLRRAAAACAAGWPFLDSADTPVSAASFECARLAAGGVLAAAQAVMDGTVRNAFCAVRPPGHHALPGRAMGFCLLNHAAIAARCLLRQHGLDRVLIVDWDVHHGNGTQAVFEADAAVLVVSVHQWPHYPGTGRADERGTGPGAGFTVNLPLPRGAGSVEYRRVFEERLIPAARAFRPDFVLVSAGFDALAGDPLGGMALAPPDFGDLTRLVRGLAAEHARERLVLILEGGYRLDALAEAVEHTLRALL